MKHLLEATERENERMSWKKVVVVQSGRDAIQEKDCSFSWEREGEREIKHPTLPNCHSELANQFSEYSLSLSSFCSF